MSIAAARRRAGRGVTKHRHIVTSVEDSEQRGARAMNHCRRPGDHSLKELISCAIAGIVFGIWFAIIVGAILEALR